MEPGYSPYTAKKRVSAFRLPQVSGRFKKIFLTIVGVLLGIFLLFYWWLGPLRFFMNHYLGLTWFAKNYLVVLQNNYELRPGGGFITAYGNLDTLLGFPRGMSFHNSYEIDTASYVKPPYPQEDFLKNEWYQGYTFRDANWEADFPTVSKDLVDFYKKKFPDADVDGVIVANFGLIEDLVEELGDIEVDGKTLTRQNLFAELELAVNDVDRHSEEALGSRKDILSALASELVGKLKWHPGVAKKVILEGLKNKNLYLWFASDGLEQRVIERDWGNALVLPEDSDFFSANLANLGAKKADRYMTREVHHYVNLAKEVPEVQSEVTLRFPGFTNSYSDNYKGYLRVYIPGTATLQDKPVDSNVERQGDFTVIGIKVIIPAGSKTTLSYNYTLPRTLKEESYHLRLVKQSGNDTEYHLTLEGPADTILESTDFEVRENRAMWNGVLTTDRDLTLMLGGDRTPPYPLEQKFIDLNTIEIYWSEPLVPGSAKDATRYFIWDDNKVNEAKDEAKVVSVELVTPSITRLKLENVVRQDLERYKIELKDLEDLAGNRITPNPKTITVVQRFEAQPTPLNSPNPTE
ncbi:MAG: DUF4012 domain-containing protein [Candidatus Peregrinibacteria bacterium]